MTEENSNNVVPPSDPVPAPAKLSVTYDKNKYSNINFDPKDQQNSHDKFPSVVVNIMQEVGIPQDKAQPLFDKLCERHNLFIDVVDKTIDTAILRNTEERKAKLEEERKAANEANEALIAKEFGEERQKIIDHASAKAKGFGFEGDDLNNFVDGISNDLTALRFVKNYMSEHKDVGVTASNASKSETKKDHVTMRDLYEFSLRK